MSQKTIYLPEIGSVIFKKSQKARRLNIRIKPFGGVIVSFPARYTYQQAEAVVLQKKAWIQKHLPRIQALENQYTIFDESTHFQTRHHQLQILPHSLTTVKSRITRDQIQFYYPRHLDIKEESLQKAIRAAIEKAWRKEAKAYLPLRLAELAQQFHFQYQKVSIKNTRSRWGSCSAQNNINLNLHLMRLPDELIDYVLLHELCHTVEKNHGKKFWALLDQVSGNARGLDKQLSHYHIGIY